MLQLVRGCSLGSNGLQMCNSWLRLKFEGRSGRDENAVCLSVCLSVDLRLRLANRETPEPLFLFQARADISATFLIVKIITGIFSVKSLTNARNMDVIHNHEYYTSLFVGSKLLTFSARSYRMPCSSIIAMKSFHKVSNLRSFVANSDSII
jgi:hypothetical protein